jgi:hypothetical protein
MEKIICSLEDWDTIFDYYRPNGSSKTWYIKELKKLAIPHTWGEWNMLTEDGEMFEPEKLKNQITPKICNLISYVPKNELNDSPHIYIINIYTDGFFVNNREIGFQCISDQYIEDIKKGKSKILMFFMYEGYSGMKNNQDFEIIEEWRLKSNLPEDSIFYVCGNLLSEKIVSERKLGFKAKGISHFEPWNKYKGEIITFEPVNNKHLFLSYNRQFRHHRIKFIIDLVEKNLIDSGLISINKISHIPYDVNEKIKDFFNERTPMVIDTMPELKYNLAINITIEDFKRTFISVVTETLVEDGTLFFSEKIWKPIMVGHPFMIYGNQNSLKYLKSLGFKTFDKWIDESYDNEPDKDKRSIMIVNELEKLNLKSLNELKILREEMFEVCEFNYNHFKSYYFENYGDIDESKTISDVLTYLWQDLNKNNNDKNIKTLV